MSIIYHKVAWRASQPLYLKAISLCQISIYTHLYIYTYIYSQLSSYDSYNTPGIQGKYIQTIPKYTTIIYCLKIYLKINMHGTLLL